jgi:hypothetical protein
MHPKGFDVESAIQAHVTEGIVHGPLPPSSALIGILKVKDGTKHMSGVHLLQLMATTHGLYQALLPAISNAHGAHSNAGQMMLRLWLPEPIVRHALPEMVAAHHSGHTNERGKRLKGGTLNKARYIELTDDESDGPPTDVIELMDDDEPDGLPTEVIDLTLVE